MAEFRLWYLYTILSFLVCFKRLDFQSSILHEDNKIEGKSSESKCFMCYLFGVVQQKTGLFQMFILYNLHLCGLGLVYLFTPGKDALC